MKVKNNMPKLSLSLAFFVITALLGISHLLSQEPVPPKYDAHSSHRKSMSHSASADGPQTIVNVLRQDKYADDIDGEKTTATMVEVVLDPLAGSPPHRHPGPVSGYVLEGTFEFQVEGGKLLMLKAGDHFFEPKMILHKVSRNPDMISKTRVLAMIVHLSNADSIIILEPTKK